MGHYKNRPLQFLNPLGVSRPLPLSVCSPLTRPIQLQMIIASLPLLFPIPLPVALVPLSTTVSRPLP